MPRVEELASIAEEIARSFDNRVNGLEVRRQMVNDERNAARESLRSTAAARREMATALRERMTAERHALQNQSQQERETLTMHRLEMSAEQRGVLGENAARRRAEVAKQMMQASLARREMSTSIRDQLQKEHTVRKASVASLMEDMHQERLDMGAAQSKSLEEDRQRRVEEVQTFQKDVESFLAGLRDDLAQQRASVQDMLLEMHSARQAMGEEEARDLAHHRAELQAQVSESIAGFQAARVKLRSDLEEFGQQWKEFASIMRNKRASPGSQEVEEQPVGPAVPAPLEELAVRPPFEEGAESPLPSIFIPADSPGQLADEVFLAVRANPEGVKLADLESQFNISRIEMAQVLKHLIEADRVRKEDRLYFEA